MSGCAHGRWWWDTPIRRTNDPPRTLFLSHFPFFHHLRSDAKLRKNMNKKMDKWSTSHSFSFPFPLFWPLKIRCKTKKKKKKEKKMDRWSHQLSFCFPFPILVFLTAWNRTSVGALCPCRLDRISFSTKLGLIKCKRWKLRYIFLRFPNKCKGQNQTNAFLEGEAYQFSCFPGSSSSVEESS